LTTLASALPLKVLASRRQAVAAAMTANRRSNAIGAAAGKVAVSSLRIFAASNLSVVTTQPL
jgi:hypothetical protein